MNDPDEGHGFTFVYGDRQIADIEEIVGRAKDATMALSRSIRENVKVIREATNDLQRMKVPCSCGRTIQLTKLEDHKAWHQARSTP